MRLLSVHIGNITEVSFGEHRALSGINKKAFLEPVMINKLGLEGDHIGSAKHHGGPDQALYVFTEPDYAAWEREIGRTLDYGKMGENLVFSGLESAGVQVGQRFLVGETLIEATSVRIPCATLAAHMQDDKFVKRFIAMRRPGFYARVIQTGKVQAGDKVISFPAKAGAPNMLDISDLWYADARSRSREEILAMLRHPVSERLELKLKEWLN